MAKRSMFAASAAEKNSLRRTWANVRPPPSGVDAHAATISRRVPRRLSRNPSDSRAAFRTLWTVPFSRLQRAAEGCLLDSLTTGG